MTNPTSNYNFQMPTATDLVTDLPADFEVFGQAVDTRLKALQPGTTLGDLAYSSATANTNTRLPIGTSGQVLAVSGGGVPAWTTTADVTPLTTKGDLFTFTTVDARLGVGANSTVLTADSAEATGLKWATPTSPAFVGCSIYGTADQAVANNTDYTVLFNSENYDTDSFHSTATNTGRITIPAGKGGKYLVEGRIYFAAGTSNNRSLKLQKNGATINYLAYIVTAGNIVLAGACVVELAATDYLTFVAGQESGSTINIGASQTLLNATATFLGA